MSSTIISAINYMRKQVKKFNPLNPQLTGVIGNIYEKEEIKK